MIIALVLLLFAETQKGSSMAASGHFLQVSKQAAEAREQGRWADAERLYREAVRLRPDWKEGWWYLGTMFYDQDRYEEGRAVLRRFSVLDPRVAMGWAFLGLCEFETKKYAEALAHLEHAVKRGLDETSSLGVVTRYHLALLHTREGNFETALEILMRSAQLGNDKPEFVEAAGLAGLRKTLLPSELPPAELQLVLQVGRAVIDTGARRPAEAEKEFKNLVASYPQIPHLHYLFGSFLLTSDPDAGLVELKKELDLSPQDQPALVQI